jgi:hypothetical protein
VGALKLHARQTWGRGRCMCGGSKLRAIHPRKRQFQSSDMSPASIVLAHHDYHDEQNCRCEHVVQRGQ